MQDVIGFAGGFAVGFLCIASSASITSCDAVVPSLAGLLLLYRLQFLFHDELIITYMLSCNCINSHHLCISRHIARYIDLHQTDICFDYRINRIMRRFVSSNAVFMVFVLARFSLSGPHHLLAISIASDDLYVLLMSQGSTNRGTWGHCPKILVK
jgi:hypothetical protein